MVFSLHVKKYHVSAKHVKSAGSVLLSLGFPESEVAKGRLSFEHISDALCSDGYSVKEKQVAFHLKENLKVIGMKVFVALNMHVEDLPRQLPAWQKFASRAHANI